MSLFLTHLRLAKTSIKENRSRSLLTCLGIAIGVASIILILSLTGSISRLVKEQTRDIGDELIIIRPDNSTSDIASDIMRELTVSNAYLKSSLSISDVDDIAKIDGIEDVAPIAIVASTVVTEKNTVDNVPILGTSDGFFKIQPLTLRYGTILSDKFNNNTAVVGHTASLVLFNTSNPVGKTLTIYGERFVVVGVLSETDNTMNISNIDFDNSVIIEASVLDKVAGGVQVQQINAKATNIDILGDVSNKITEALKTKKNNNNFRVYYGDNITHPANTLFVIVSGMLTMVAGISLIVGGIGVMNIMLVSVNERSHEIGIRKAIGASSWNILAQFLFEALMLSLMGGFFGLILGYILAFFVSLVTPFTPFISFEILAVTFSVSLIIGIIFGIYPALKAAVRNPIESLKHYH